MIQVNVNDDLQASNLIISDGLKTELDKRINKGIITYGSALMTFNGRDAKQDIKEELLDAILYARQYFLENGEEAFPSLTANLIFIAESLI